MAGTIILKPASSRDYGFALDLYLETTQPYTSEFIVWNEAQQRERFARNWNVANVRIVCIGGKKIGWMQVDETPAEIFLQQLFILPELHRRGIGSRILTWLTSRRKARRPYGAEQQPGAPALRALRF